MADLLSKLGLSLTLPLSRLKKEGMSEMLDSIVDIGRLIVAFTQALFLLIVEPLIALLVPRSMRRHDVKGKIVLITGAGSGIGRRVAIRLAKQGAIIVSWDINEAGNAETAQIIKSSGGTCFTYQLDLCNREAIYETAAKVSQDIGKVDILINNAGIVNGRNFIDADDEQIIKTFKVNLFSCIWTTKAFLPGMMKANNGQLVTIASIAGYFGAPKMTEYCSSKSAAVRFDDALHQELMHNGYDGISLTIVCPYHINTGMFDGCKQGSLISMLDQDYVADEITDAIMMKQRELILPRTLKASILLKSLFTHRGQHAIATALGASEFMDTFSGHERTPAKAAA